MSDELRSGHKQSSNASPRPQSRRSARLEHLLTAPVSRKTPLGTDTGWAFKLKDVVDTATRELQLKVHAAKPTQVCEPNDPNDMMFEMDTDKGRLQAVRSRAGVYTFNWL